MTVADGGPPAFYVCRAVLRREAVPVELAPLDRAVCDSSRNAAAVAHALVDSPICEHFGALFLDVSRRLTGWTLGAIGTHLRTATEPRAVFVPAMLSGASELILVHTHPSGSLTPSTEDLDMTRHFREVGDLLGIGVADHLILGTAPAYLSMRSYEWD